MRRAFVGGGQRRLVPAFLRVRITSCTNNRNNVIVSLIMSAKVNRVLGEGPHSDEPTASTEMRKEIRYRLEAPAIFTWENFQNKRLQGEGLTRDISLLGAFIVTPTCPPNMSVMRVEVALPSLTGIETGFRILGRARVVRVDHLSGGRGENGFAVVRDDLSNWSLSTVGADFDWNRESVVARESNWD
jgi:hypothetical protein